MSSNRIRHTRESLMLSKAELARKAGLSALTIDRVESGRPCRLETKRRLLMALGIPLSESREAFVPLAADAPLLMPPGLMRDGAGENLIQPVP
jgi:DNA-binding XRE family transcriptional regulator